MALADAKAIYRQKYWDVLRCDELPAGVDYAVFDYGVNSGVARAPKVLHRLLGMGEGTRITDATLAAVRRHDPASLVTRLCDERLAFLKSLKTWPVFGKGWGRRVSDVRTAALVMAKEDKARMSMPAATSAAPAASKTTTATIAVAGGAAAAAAHQMGAQMTIVLTILCAAAIAGAGWFAWRRFKAGGGADAPETAEAVSPIGRLRQTLKGWKTVIFGSALTLAGAALDLLDSLKAVDISPLLPPTSALKIIAAIGVATILLRLATTGRVGQKDL
jgi:lysozyme family protein